jgi:hypothetical protein
MSVSKGAEMSHAGFLNTSVMRHSGCAGWTPRVFSLLVVIGLVALSVTGSMSSVSAAPIVINDPYGGQNNTTSTCCSGDVIGELGGFDIQSLTITQWSASNVQMNLRFNYNFGDATLANYYFSGIPGDNGSYLQVGDLLFSVGGQYKYGIALVSHAGAAVGPNNLIAGSLYQINGALTSNQFGLDSNRYTWRFNTPVRMDPTGAVLIGAGTVSTSNVGGYEVQTNFSFTPGGNFYNDLLSNAMTVQFGSAICANDVISGGIDPSTVPEPSTWLLMGLGLVGLSGWRWRQGLMQTPTL